MAVQCDVCKSEYPAGTRFCPRCALEIVPQRDRQSRPPALHKDVFDWDEQEGKPKEYVVSKHQQPRLAAQKIAEILEQAKTRLADEYVLDAAALLKQVSSDVAREPSLRATYEQLQKTLEARRQAVRDRCRTMTDDSDSDRLIAYLSGPAANELEPSEICTLALAAARTMYVAHLADEAADVLRLSPFRTLRDEQLVKDHRELEMLVSRRRHWQHWRRSVTAFGGVCVVAGIGLAVWAWFVWRFAGPARRIVVPGLLAAACFLVAFPQLRPHLEKWLSQSSAAGKLREFWKKSGKRRRGK